MNSETISDLFNSTFEKKISGETGRGRCGTDLPSADKQENRRDFFQRGLRVFSASRGCALVSSWAG